MEFDGKDIKDLMDDISAVKEAVARIEERQKHPSPACAVHAEQIKDVTRRLQVVEVQQGRQNLIAVTLGAIGAGLVLALKYLMVRSS